MDCVFCKIAKGEIKARTVVETQKSLAFLDAFPLALGHSLVIPRKHHEKIQDLSPDDNADLFGLVHRVVSMVDKVTGSTLVAVHNGKASGQEIPHVHVHLVPRSPDDSAGPIHSMFSKRPKFSDEQFDDVLKKIKSN
ncbi:HIT family protein [Candidatus Nitrosotenuis sp. DW1]|uniref:HIT family protein n=1 Tax=Candidatus Nitrosotenuis sp. DW1 TaxID=2259672 RepID=UPI0015CA6483|nr:HIT domain-containing protein [Candidatus Nitrosotenuis sp. DW1]QLH09082.1 HIT family protein [Candidatus Nitrosotenuis sp. DW1]